MSFAAEFDAIAKLLQEAAAQIANGVEAGYADEEDQHPMATHMRRVERQCRRKAAELWHFAAAMRAARQQSHGNRDRRIARLKREGKAA